MFAVQILVCKYPGSQNIAQKLWARKSEDTSPLEPSGPGVPYTLISPYTLPAALLACRFVGKDISPKH